MGHWWGTTVPYGVPRNTAINKAIMQNGTVGQRDRAFPNFPCIYYINLLIINSSVPCVPL